MNKRILVTGATGFVGSNLIKKLLEKGEDEIHILLRKNSNTWRIKGDLSNIKLKIHFVDILDFELLKETIQNINPNIIIHAAVYGGYYTQQDTRKIIETDFIGTVNILEATKNINYDLFINTGSSSEYGAKENPMKESNLLEPNTEYGVAKSAATLYCSQFAKKNKKPIITLRLFSVYGYYERKDRLVPYVLSNYLEGKPIILNNPKVARDFIFIEDVVDAYMKAIHSPDIFYGEVFNVGTGQQRHIEDVAMNVIKDNPGYPTKYNESLGRSFDAFNWVADISKIKRSLGWEPKYSLQEGISKTLNWFKENLKIYSEETINTLQNRANKMRLKIAKILEKTSGSHIGGDYSILDILNVLYFNIMNVDPNNPSMDKRDKLLFSKGHNSLALYTTLCEKGFFSEEILQNYCQNGSLLEGHVNHLVPGVEVSSGSLGHGLAIGIGMAIANKNDNNPGKIFVVMGDGECNEGSVWEAAIFATKMKLDNLIVIIDANRFQGIDGTKEVYGTDDKLKNLWKSFGFEVKEVDGHDYGELIKIFENIPFAEKKPSLIFANTIKGKGVSFMENKLEWHYKSPNKEQLKIIEEELMKK